MIAGKIQTVLGAVAAEDLGTVLPHEHILVDFRSGMVGPQRDLELTMENLGTIRRLPYSVPGNLLLDEVDKATSEVELFAKAGGGTICELSVVGMRCESYQPHQLAQISQKTGVNIVHGTGFYWNSFLPEKVRAMGVREMKDFMEGEICGGREREEKCGVMYIGCSWPLKDSECHALEAAALTQKETGAPLIVHPGDENTPCEVIELLTKYGADISHTVITHVERTAPSDKQLLELVRHGCYVNHSFFGKECSHYQFNTKFDMPSDAQRIQRVKKLVDSGYGDRVLISQDIVCKHELVCYGGHGYTHILEHIAHKMAERGISRDTVNKILTKNPQKWLTFT